MSPNDVPLSQIDKEYWQALVIINGLRVSNEALLAALKALRWNPGLHASCVLFDTEGSDNTDVIEVDDRCEECRDADALIAQAEAGARSPGVTKLTEDKNDLSRAEESRGNTEAVVPRPSTK